MLSVKVLFKLPLRQAVGMVRALLKLAGLNWPVPDYSTLCRRQRHSPSRSPRPANGGRVYPRVGGGALGGGPADTNTTGLSPRGGGAALPVEK